MSLQIEQLWKAARFDPNREQRKAIHHVDGPLFLTAGPGTGKTRVLLWRTLNLIVFHDVLPEQIFLGTFTEKAALQLKEGLIAYLSEATRLTEQSYDISRMLVGTVHSICRRLLSDRRFSVGRMRPARLSLADDLEQYFFVLRNWAELISARGLGVTDINQYLSDNNNRSTSRHRAVAAVIALFNRFSEECLVPDECIRKTRDPMLKKLLHMYAAYKGMQLTDLSLLQQAALDHIRASDTSQSVLRHVIVDEYQDTNHVQEELFFHLAKAHRNLCVVGDDDQALYRFRGSTVENLVEFEDRCATRFGIRPRTINLSTNYRSRQTIVDFYSRFIRQIDWTKKNGSGAYRVQEKKIKAAREDAIPAVVASSPADPKSVCEQVATLVRRLIDAKKVQDPNQIAFLYPSLGSTQVPLMVEALEKRGLRAYAPRAGQFLEIDEAKDVFGAFLVLFGRPNVTSPGMAEFADWIARAHKRGKQVILHDRSLAAFMKSRQEQIARVLRDRRLLVEAVGEHALEREIDAEAIKKLQTMPKLSVRARIYLRGRGLQRLINARRTAGRRLLLRNVINRVTTLNWGVLDLFYELSRFAHFRRAFDLAEHGQDEGPICNLALVTDYLGRFQALNSTVLSASFLENRGFVQSFFNSFLYGLWRRGESEYENADDPFPKGRIPFITVHQAKGLEFPVVVLGNPRKQERVPRIETIVRPFTQRSGEPLQRIPTFDNARLFYVALSRPKNLLILCEYRGRGQHMNPPFPSLVDDNFLRIPNIEMDSIPCAEASQADDLPKAYSYTGDYLSYRACPRRYMIYRRYNFTPARGETMVFGSLVHRTVEDLHHWLRAQHESGRAVA